MRLHYIALATILSFMINMNAQEKAPQPKGKVIGKVFVNYHFEIESEAEQTSAFELTRAYLGYKYKFNDKFSATVLVDAGKGSKGSDYSVFIKNAKLDFKANKWLTLTGGIFGLKLFKDQEKFWGYRYLYKSLGDEYKFGTSADLGIMASIKINKQLKLDLIAVNGEGYKKLQDSSGKNRYGANLVYTPIENLILKAYYDCMKGVDIEDEDENTVVSNIVLFAGFKLDKFRIGAEYNLMKDGTTYKKPSKGKDLQGLSFYSTYQINDKWGVFGRYDDLSSNTLSGEMMDWNYSNDGGTIIAGFEYKPIKYVKTSLNYRRTDFKDPLEDDASFIYANVGFSF